MADQIDPAVIKKTQDLLGKVIKKPPLNEKLLRKPPFRFLHDIITNVIKTTKFFEGLYSADELLSENVKDKEKKTTFLQKAIDVTIMVTGENLAAKPTKIVSGHEPQKTNEFLQAISKAILEKKVSTEAVQKVLNGEKPNLSLGKKKASDVSDRGKRREPSNKDNKSNTEKSSSRINELKTRGSLRNVSDQNKSRDRNKTKERGNSKDRAKPKTRAQATEQNKVPSPPKAKLMEKDDEITKESPSKKANVENIPVSLDGDKENNSISPTRILQNSDVKEEKDTTLETENSQNHNAVVSPPESATRPTTAVRLPSAKPKPKPVSPIEKPQEPEPPPEAVPNSSTSRPVRSALKSARPSSARPAPPKIRIRHIVENEEQIRQPSAKPVANVILDTKESSDNEDDTFITEEPPEPSVIDNSLEPSTTLNTEEEPQGSLVKQLLETKKDLEGGSQQIPTKKVEIDKSLVTDVAKKRERETIGKELEHLRSFIQTVSRSANPLGKILDYLQEDIDSMQQELKMWQNEHQQNLIALSREESATENALDPLRTQLEELDQAVQDQSDSISTLKASILRNDERIHRMLAAVNHPVNS